jgi:hypothetical protein
MSTRNFQVSAGRLERSIQNGLFTLLQLSQYIRISAVSQRFPGTAKPAENYPAKYG